MVVTRADGPVDSDSEIEVESVLSGTEEDGLVDLDSILEWRGLNDPAQREMVIDQLFSTGMDALGEETVTRIREYYIGLKRYDGITVDRSVVNVTVSLMHMVQDLKRVGIEDTLSFDSLDELEEYVVASNDLHKNDPKDGYPQAKASDIVVSDKLRNETNFVPWCRELMNQLSTQRNANGVPLTYVLRKNDEPVIPHSQECLMDVENFDECLIKSAPLEGIEWKVDTKLILGVLSSSVQNPSDAYTLLKSTFKSNDGRKVWKSLLAAYDNEHVRRARIRVAERELEKLFYKSESHGTFPHFLSKFLQLLEELKNLERPVLTEKALELIFQKIQCPKLESYKRVLHLKYTDGEYTNLTPTVLLQKFQAQLHELISEPRGFDRAVSAAGKATGETTENIETTSDGPAPEEGPFTPEGKLFVGSYPKEKWIHSSMDAYRGQIMKAHKSKRLAKSRKREPEADKPHHSNSSRKDKSNKKLKRELAAAGVLHDSSDESSDNYSESDDYSDSEDDSSTDTYNTTATGGRRKRRKSRG